MSDHAKSAPMKDFSLKDDSPLEEVEQKMLHLETLHWKYAGAKESAIHEHFSLSPIHYYQILNRLIDTEKALAHNPVLVGRLRGMRSSRRRIH